MGEKKKTLEVNEGRKEKLISILTEELLVLRVKLGLSQTEISEIVGISRQTYSAIETQKRGMPWGTFLALVLFFEHNEKTRMILVNIESFYAELESLLNINPKG